MKRKEKSEEEEEEENEEKEYTGMREENFEAKQY